MLFIEEAEHAIATIEVKTETAASQVISVTSRVE